MTPRANLLDHSPESFEEWCLSKGFQTFRAVQVYEWIYRHLETDPDRMTNLPKSFREAVSGTFTILATALKNRVTDADRTTKFLFGFQDGHTAETVFIPEPDRYTLCLSSQIGCMLGCRFCATGAMGIVRNLGAGEIISQVLHVRMLTRCDTRGNIVLMGMGEPLLNTGAVTDAISRITDPRCLGWSPRRITLSTAGIVPEIRRLAEMDLGINLAVSLNAADDRTRSRLMPINKKYPLKMLMEALRDYPIRSRQQRITCEYVMIRGINDDADCADRLIRLLDRRRFKVNLIPFHDVSSTRFRSSDAATILAFQNRLKNAGFTVRIRSSRGIAIHAACGQLAGSSRTDQEE